MGPEETLCFFVCYPDGGKAGRFGRHDVDPVTEINRQFLDTGTGKFENLILDKSVFEGRADKSERDVMRTDAFFRFTRQIHQNHFRRLDVVGTLHQLLDQLSTTFADRESAQCAVTGVRVRTENHFAAARHFLACKRVNDRLIGGDKDSAVFFCGGKPEHVVVFVDGAADRAQGVVAVGESVGDREFAKPRRACCLNDTDIGNVVGEHGIKPDLERLLVTGSIVCR